MLNNVETAALVVLLALAGGMVGHILNEFVRFLLERGRTNRGRKFTDREPK